MVGRMAVEIDGAGEPIVLLHGLGGTSNTWTGLMPALGRYQTIRIDLPGAGRSHLVEGPLSVQSLLQAIERVMQVLSIHKAHFIGHSMGTILATHLASTTKRVRSLLLFGPLLCPPDTARQNIRLRAVKARNEGAAGMQAIADALVQGSTSSETKLRRSASVAFVRESLMRQCADGYARNCEALAEAQAADTASIKCPTLLVTGDEDGVAPPQAVRGMHERIAESRMEVLRGCGHWTPIEMPEECASLARQFYTQRFV
jgi:3-oxoadipate enol-lactonase